MTSSKLFLAFCLTVLNGFVIGIFESARLHAIPGIIEVNTLTHLRSKIAPKIRCTIPKSTYPGRLKDCDKLINRINRSIKRGIVLYLVQIKSNR